MRNEVTASITLVEHGYQIDIRDYTKATADGNGVEVASVCRDFGGHYDIGQLASSVVATLIVAMEKLEENHQKILRTAKPRCIALRGVKKNRKQKSRKDL